MSKIIAVFYKQPTKRFYMAIIENQETKIKPKRKRIQAMRKGFIVAKSYVVLPKNPYSAVAVLYNDISHKIISKRIEIIGECV